MNFAEKLVRMANQIALNFEIHGQSGAVDQTSEHIRKFWDPRMRRQMSEYIARDGSGLSPVALSACKLACDETS